MSMFMGEFNHTIDAKRQADHSFTIPGRIRSGICDDKGIGWMPVCVPTKRMGKVFKGKLKNFATY